MNVFPTDANEYFLKCRELFSKPNISADEISAFLKHERQYRFYQQPEYAENYIQIFTIIRDRIIVPNAGKLDHVRMFTDIFFVFKASGIKLPHNPNIENYITSLLNAIGENNHFWKHKIVHMVLILKTFNNEDWKDGYLKYLFNIPSAGCFQSYNEAQQQARVFRSVFSSCKEMMQCAERAVFTDDFFQRELLQQKSAFMWILEVVWNLAFKESPEHMEIMPKWFDMFDQALKSDDRELIFYMHMPLSHIYLNMCHTQDAFKVFNDRVEMPLSKYIQKNMRRWGHKPTKKKMPGDNGRRIAFVYDRLVGNSPVKLLVSLLTYLKDEGDIELFVYDMGYVEKAKSDPVMIEEVKALGVKYINNHDLIDDADKGHHYSHYSKAVKLREQAVNDDIDILIMMGNRMSSGFMFATRTAPLQIFWDHGNHEYDVKNIDKRICHFDDGYVNSFCFERFELRMLDKYLRAEEENNKIQAANIKAKLPEHGAVLGSIGRLMKLSDEYLKAVSEIMKQHPDTMYLACGAGNKEELFIKAKNAGIDMSRFIMTGWVNPHVYGHVIDVYLNTFPLVGGESVNEFIAKGENKYVISLRQ